MTYLDVFLYFLIAVLSIAYFVGWALILGDLSSMRTGYSGPITLDSTQNGNFKSSAKRNSQGGIRIMGWLMMCIAVLLMIINAQYHSIGALIAVLVAIFHFYLASQISD